MKYTKDKEFIGRMFDEISPTYDRLNHLLSGYQDIRWRKKAVKYLSALQPKYSLILDLAAGSGDLGKEFLKLSPDKINSVDLSAEMLKINKEKLPENINQTIQADAENLPFDDNSFDLCGIAFGVRNFKNLEKCLIEINRVLKPGAKFLTIEMFKPAKRSLTTHLFRLYFEKLLPKIGNTLSKSRYAYSYLFESVDSFIKADDYIQLLEKTGFKTFKKSDNFLGIVCSVFAEKV